MATIGSVLINDLQDHFDGRGRLKKASMALRCYSKDASIFFSYIDGFGKKQYVNLPIEPSDILPILERYIERIDEDIAKQMQGCAPLKVVIVNVSDLMPYIEDYQYRYPSTCTSLNEIINRLEDAYRCRLDDPQYEGDEDYHIEVCSDWLDKIYVFSMRDRVDDVIHFHFKEIYKL